jgi:hypothetical protein
MVQAKILPHPRSADVVVMNTSMQLRSPAGTVVGEDVLAALSHALFCTSLEPGDHPGEDRIRAAVLHRLGTDLSSSCLLQVAQEAGDHPLRYAQRMTWCREMVMLVFFGKHASDRNRARGSA